MSYLVELPAAGEVHDAGGETTEVGRRALVGGGGGAGLAAGRAGGGGVGGGEDSGRVGRRRGEGREERLAAGGRRRGGEEPRPYQHHLALRAGVVSCDCEHGREWNQWIESRGRRCPVVWWLRCVVAVALGADLWGLPSASSAGQQDPL